MQQTLPRFEKVTPQLARTTFAGGTTSKFGAIAYEEKMFVVCEVECDAIGHDKAPGGMVRDQRLKVLRWAQVDEAIATEVLGYAEEEERKLLDTELGRQPMFDKDGNPITDEPENGDAPKRSRRRKDTETTV